MARGMFHTTEPHAQCINWVSYPGEGLTMVQDGFGTGQQVSNYIMHHLLLLGFTSFSSSSLSSSLSSFCSSSDYYYYYYYIITIITLH